MKIKDPIVKHLNLGVSAIIEEYRGNLKAYPELTQAYSDCAGPLDENDPEKGLMVFAIVNAAIAKSKKKLK